MNFINYLKNRQIERAFDNHTSSCLKIIYNEKERIINKTTWIRYLRKNLVNPSTEILQFNINEITSLNNVSLKFKINMICKNIKGGLFFNEIDVKKISNNNVIHSLKFNINSH